MSTPRRGPECNRLQNNGSADTLFCRKDLPFHRRRSGDLKKSTGRPENSGSRRNWHSGTDVARLVAGAQIAGVAEVGGLDLGPLAGNDVGQHPP